MKGLGSIVVPSGSWQPAQDQHAAAAWRQDHKDSTTQPAGHVPASEITSLTAQLGLFVFFFFQQNDFSFVVEK